MNDPYYIIAAHAHGEYEEKKSRFLGDIFPVSGVTDAEEHLAGIKKQHYDARHHCYAYIIGENKDQMKSSDNGEPSGTAGRPIMEVLQGAGVTDVILIVTRYFGGTLLGTGGLVRAYTAAAKAAVDNAEKIRMIYGQTIGLKFSYTHLTPVQRFLSERGITLGDPVYAEDVTASVTVPVEKVQKVCAALTDLSGGTIVITPGREGYSPE